MQKHLHKGQSLVKDDAAVRLDDGGAKITAR